MPDQKLCLRCERAIDGYARICPYCNWDQSDTTPPKQVQQPASTYVPPAERGWRQHILIAVAGVGLLIASFAVGALINRDGAPEEVVPDPITTSEGGSQPVSRPRRADVTLVPVTDIEAPITTAPVDVPADGTPPEYQRSDATAVSSVEYAQLAARARQEKKRNATLIDPRSLTGPAYAQAPPRPEPPAAAPAMDAAPARSQEADRARVVVRTRPVPTFQPIPDIDVPKNAVARFDLLVGPDGRVREVNLREGIPGQTAKLVSTLQKWRFKPATENGVPVSAPFTVDISFRGNE